MLFKNTFEYIKVAMDAFFPFPNIFSIHKKKCIFQISRIFYLYIETHTHSVRIHVPNFTDFYWRFYSIF